MSERPQITMPAWKRRTIGIITLGGSATGIAVISAQVLGAPLNPFTLVVLLIFAVLYAFGIFAGMLLLEQDPRSIIKVFSFWVFQIPVISSSWITYEFFAGLRFNFTVSTEGVVTFMPAIGSQFSLLIGHDTPTVFGVNFVAIAVVFVTWKLRHEAI